MAGLPAWAGEHGVPAGVSTTGATSSRARVDLRVLVLDDGQPMVGAIVAQLEREGTPFTRIDLDDPARELLTRDLVQAHDKAGPRARFQAVVAPSHAPAALSPQELSVLYSFEASFGIRHVSAYDEPGPAVGLGEVVYSGPMDGTSATLSPAAKASGFGHLSGDLTFDDFDPAVVESSGSVANADPALPPGSSYTPFLTVALADGRTGSVMGVHQQGRREELVLTFAQNEYQQHSAILGHGILQWMTRGVHLGEYRNYLAVHIDDVFMADGMWSIDGRCTIGSGCDPAVYPPDGPDATSRMVPADVEIARTWQRENGLLLDMAYNSDGSVEYAADHARKDPLLDAFKKRRTDFRWLNHTRSHLYLGCVKDETTTPWTCSRDARGRTVFVDAATIEAEIVDNEDWGDRNGFATDHQELVTGEHSGLASLPQMPQDNPNLAGALQRAGTRYVASDASREHEQRAVGPKSLTVPRYPMNVYYNTATYEQAASEYNWIYTARADGGSGMCEDLPAIMTCIAPLDLDSGYLDYVVPQEIRTTLRHVTTSDPRPHYAHQPNLTGDRVLYPVLDGVVGQYRALYDTRSAPLLNPRLEEIGDRMERSASWDAAKDEVTATLVGTTVRLTGGDTDADVPLTAGPNTSSRSLEERYAGSRSEFLDVRARRTTSVKLSSKDLAYPTYRPVTLTVVPLPAAFASRALAPDRLTTVVPLVEADALAVPHPS
ncbi:hypothetical protein [Cellulosimicrobium cellulans]|uniref:hypothetical protein n=1 Tax=Cellulosimicrobium cellulans TaxID=1710 RepID=UPI0024075297|nr:hypothetical protein [Cellulosimicrobium cellulans]